MRMSLNERNRCRLMEIVAAVVLIGMCFLPMAVTAAMGIYLEPWKLGLLSWASFLVGIWLYLRISPCHGKSGSRPYRMQP